MVQVIELTGKKASNLIGGLGEIIAWDTLRKKGIWAYKIGSWSFFPEGYPYWKGELNAEHGFLTREQAKYVENKVSNGIIEFDLVGVKWEREIPDSGTKVEGVYLIEVKAGRGANIRHYINNPLRAFARENVEEAKALGFRILLVTVELLDDWKCEVACKEL
jgi:hypothetical protein